MKTIETSPLNNLNYYNQILKNLSTLDLISLKYLMFSKNTRNHFHHRHSPPLLWTMIVVDKRNSRSIHICLFRHDRRPRLFRFLCVTIWVCWALSFDCRPRWKRLAFRSSCSSSRGPSDRRHRHRRTRTDVSVTTPHRTRSHRYIQMCTVAWNFPEFKKFNSTLFPY